VAETTALRRRELDAERQAVKARVTKMRRRLADDRDSVRDEASRLVGPDSPMSEHPRLLVTGSAAAGFMLGKAGPGLPHPPTFPVKAIKGAAGKASGKAAGAVTDGLKVQAGVILKDFLSGVFGDGRPTPGMTADYDQAP
jgi:hypothetical protein